MTLRSFQATATLVHGALDDGVLFAHGDQGGGYVVYVEGRRLRLAYNEYGDLYEADAGPLSAGSHDVTLDVEGIADYQWNLALLVDGEERARLDGALMLLGMAPFQGIDVGINRRSPVSWPVFERHGSFPTGDLESVTYVPGAYAPYSPEPYWRQRSRRPMPTSEPLVEQHLRSVSLTSSARGLFEFTNGAVTVQSSRDGDHGVHAVDLLLAALADVRRRHRARLRRASRGDRSRPGARRRHGRRGRSAHATGDGDSGDRPRGRGSAQTQNALVSCVPVRTAVSIRRSVVESTRSSSRSTVASSCPLVGLVSVSRHERPRPTS